MSEQLPYDQTLEYSLRKRITEQAVEILELIERNAALVNALGLVSTLHPTLQVDVNHPFEMAHQIVKFVNKDKSDT